MGFRNPCQPRKSAGTVLYYADVMTSTRNELTITGVSLDNRNGEPQVLLHECRSGNLLSMPVGPYEAGAILVELSDDQAPESFAHDLVVELFHLHGFTPSHLELSLEAERGTRLYYTAEEELCSLPLRASDGMALCLRMGVPMYAASGALQRDASR